MSTENEELCEKPIIISAFTAYSRENKITILKAGQVEFGCTIRQNTETKGYIEINGNNLEISTFNEKSDQPRKTINENTCLLLLAEDSSLTSYYRAVLVDSIPEIVTAAFKLLDS